jgi:transposase
VKSQKTDDRDAEAITEAATRPTIRLVTLKSEAQLDLQVLHRGTRAWSQARTAVAAIRCGRCAVGYFTVRCDLTHVVGPRRTRCL